MEKDYIYNENIDTMIINGVIPSIEKIINSSKKHNAPVDLTIKRISDIINSYNEYCERSKEESKIKINLRAPEDIKCTPDEILEVCEGQPIEHYHEKDTLESLINAKIYRDNLSL